MRLGVRARRCALARPRFLGVELTDAKPGLGSSQEKNNFSLEQQGVSLRGGSLQASSPAGARGLEQRLAHCGLGALSC